jgi:glycosyltransferase involved in cell wall biosynthesis
MNKIIIFDPLKIEGGQEKFIINLANSLLLKSEVLFIHENEKNYLIKNLFSSRIVINYLFPNLFILYNKLKYADIIILNGERALALSILLNIFSRKKIYYINHLIFLDSLSAKSKFVSYIYNSIYRILLKFVYKTIAISEPNFKTLSCFYGQKKLLLIKNGVQPLSRHEKPFNFQDIKIGFIGRLDYQKGIHVIAKVASCLKSMTNIRFIIYGKGELDYLFDNLTNVCLKGHIENLNEAYSNLDIIIFPSLYEGLSLSLLEAMSTGIPIILSEIPSFTAVLDDNSALFFKVNNEISLIESIKLLSQNSELRSAISANSYYKYVNHYGFDTMVDNYLNEFALHIK